jgi:hypothetical protein
MDKIDILFKEYDTLRGEIITRGNSRDQLLEFSALILAGLLAWIVSQPIHWVLIVVVSVILVSIILTLYRWSVREIDTIAKRLRKLEKLINEIAVAELLEWETRWGSGVTGYIFRGDPRTGPIPEAYSPPVLPGL